MLTIVLDASEPLCYAQNNKGILEPMSKDHIFDIKTGKRAKKPNTNKVKAKLWDKLYRLMSEGLLGVVIAETRLSKSELNAMVELWHEEIAKEDKVKKRAKSKERMQKHRTSKRK